MLTPDIYISVNFYATEKDGRKLPTDPHIFSSIFVIDQSKHDCRLLLDQVGSILPGDYKKSVPVKFLYPKLVIPKLKVGTKFYLWDMRNIAEGEVLEIVINQK